MQLDAGIKMILDIIFPHSKYLQIKIEDTHLLSLGSISIKVNAEEIYQLLWQSCEPKWVKLFASHPAQWMSEFKDSVKSIRSVH